MKIDTIIIGAGVAGLAAARVLEETECRVLVLDKGRGVGGRLATRRLGDRDAPRGRWDHGAQFFTLRSSALQRRLEGWGALKAVVPWHDAENGLIRYRGESGINDFAKAFAQGVTVQQGQRVVNLHKTAGGWTVETEDGNTYTAGTLISTQPAPQLLDLLQASGLTLPGAALLETIGYERTLTLLMELAGPSGMEAPGLLRPVSGILQTVVDHQVKGISDTPTLTVHATPEFSLEWYERDRNVMASVMRAAVMELLDVDVVSVQHHGWKFAHPHTRVAEPFLLVGERFWAAGDGFCAGDGEVDAGAQPRIESAILSGIQAAEASIRG